MGEIRVTPRAQKTRSAIEHAGLKLFAANAVESVSIDDIVRTANVAKGSFYNHFDDRSALVMSLLRGIRAEIEASVQTANAQIDDPAERIITGIFIYGRFSLQEHERASVLIRIERFGIDINYPLNKGVLNDLQSGINSGQFNLNSLETAFIFTMSISRGLATHFINNRDLSKASEISKSLGCSLLRGLGIGDQNSKRIVERAYQAVMGNMHSD